MARNETLVQVREFARQPFAWPGGYPKALIMQDGECLCSGCARKEYRQISQATRGGLRDDWAAVGVQLHMEGAPLVCANCGQQIESAYGDPQAEK